MIWIRHDTTFVSLQDITAIWVEPYDEGGGYIINYRIGDDVYSIPTVFKTAKSAVDAINSILNTSKSIVCEIGG